MYDTDRVGVSVVYSFCCAVMVQRSTILHCVNIHLCEFFHKNTHEPLLHLWLGKPMVIYARLLGAVINYWLQNSQYFYRIFKENKRTEIALEMAGEDRFLALLETGEN